MVKHTVLFRLKDKADRDKAITSMKSMIGKIEGMTSLEVGMDFSNTPVSCDIVLTTTHIDKKALDLYVSHPVHQPVKELMGQLLKEIYFVDYEV